MKLRNENEESTSGKEMSLFESSGTRSKSLENHLNALLTVFLEALLQKEEVS